jgi:hypothetical protein
MPIYKYKEQLTFSSWLRNTSNSSVARATRNTQHSRVNKKIIFLQKDMTKVLSENHFAIWTAHYILTEQSGLKMTSHIRRNGDWIPVGTGFSSPVLTGPGAHWASYTMGTWSFPGVIWLERGVDHPPSCTDVKERVELYLYSPSEPLWPVIGWPLPLPLPHKKKNKAIPLQAWRGPEGSRRLRLPDFKTISTRRW